jgi:hypothetical protein
MKGADLDERPAVVRLLGDLKDALPRLKALLAECDDEWAAEDRVYRFYHGSFKVYGLQDLTTRIADELRALAPREFLEKDNWLGRFEEDPEFKKLAALKGDEGRFQRGKLDGWFETIVAEGTGKKFDRSHNDAWIRHTRPIVEAFFHARYFLGMACRYGDELQHPPSLLPSGWAAILYLYGLR